ncbi:XRE family transcriptional regulator [Corallococcus sp. AB018]|uniref:helix-turn-helix domain-containing protein n=1 Tax=Corallococcus TaxID=83461 RepID=UPI000F86338A|nr:MULTISPECIES: helix-turn-helix transcriptional regulator [Corallococcus]NRD50813.1 helix-turn-helix transcriptional regulator [Corallococcus exiguus]RUO94828.1 XRE family transcriptional regulator [Corallococcus sp. AB018]
MKQAKYTAGYAAAFRLLDSFLGLLEQRGMKRTDLAKKLGVERSAVTRWLSPNRNLTVFTAAMIAEALGAELQFVLVDREAQKAEAPPVETVQASPEPRREYRKAPAPRHTYITETALPVAVSNLRLFSRGVETSTTQGEYIHLHSV